MSKGIQEKSKILAERLFVELKKNSMTMSQVSEFCGITYAMARSLIVDMTYLYPIYDDDTETGVPVYKVMK